MNIEREQEVIIAQKLEKLQTSAPGNRLKEARKAKRLSIDEVAKQLNLTVFMIEKIENDDYHKIPGITFIRGYLRSYARLIGVNPDEIVKEFDNLNLKDRPAPMSTLRIYKSKKHPIRKNLSWIGLLGGIVIVLIIAFGLHSKFSSNEATLNTVNAGISANSLIENGSSALVNNNANASGTPLLATTVEQPADNSIAGPSPNDNTKTVAGAQAQSDGSMQNSQIVSAQNHQDNSSKTKSIKKHKEKNQSNQIQAPF